jgi:hypothetical protein
VNVKNYGNVLGGLDIGAHPGDYTLVLTGPPQGGMVGGPPPSLAHHRGVPVRDDPTAGHPHRPRGEIATSLRKADVEAAQVFPQSDRSPLRLSADQVALLQLFGGATATTYAVVGRLADLRVVSPRGST